MRPEEQLAASATSNRPDGDQRAESNQHGTLPELAPDHDADPREDGYERDYHAG